MITEDEIFAELKKIQESVPRSYYKNLFIKRKISPDVEKAFQLAVKDTSISEEKRRQFQVLLDSGELSREEEVENEIAANKINKWVDKKIAESIKAGRLPDKEELKKLYEDKKGKIM